MAKRVNKLIKLRANRAATATERGNSLDPTVYTRHVQQAQPTCCGVSLQHFNISEDFENEPVTTIRSSPKQKATGQDAIANEMLDFCPELSGKVLYVFWKACGQLACTKPHGMRAPYVLSTNTDHTATPTTIVG